jgi:tRNA-dihydrouridine synthase
MQIYLAPLQGLTDRIFRESFSQHIAQFDKTFAPFIRVQNQSFYRPSQCNDILEIHNQQQKPVPQFLGNDAESFRVFADLCEKNNYSEVNINMGCPYPMVTAKKMGAGILAHPKLIEQLLTDIFRDTKLKISIKCRLGLESNAEFDALIPIFNAFPLEELIIHPRIGKQQYKGEADRDRFVKLASQIKHSICYNGDIKNKADMENLLEKYPNIDKIMIGRSLLENPFLLHDLRNETLDQNQRQEMMRAFHQRIMELCKEKYSGDTHFLKSMQELWSYQSLAFNESHKVFKKVKKSKSFTQYEEAVFGAINNHIK